MSLWGLVVLGLPFGLAIGEPLGKGDLEGVGTNAVALVKSSVAVLPGCLAVLVLQGDGVSSVGLADRRRTQLDLSHCALVRHGGCLVDMRRILSRNQHKAGLAVKALLHHLVFASRCLVEDPGRRLLSLHLVSVLCGATDVERRASAASADESEPKDDGQDGRNCSVHVVPPLRAESRTEPFKS